MKYEDRQEADLDLQRLGQEIHGTEMTIYAGRQAVSALRAQEPVNEVALAVHYETVRAAHHRRHEQEHQLRAAKKAAQAALWPLSGIPTWS